MKIYSSLPVSGLGARWLLVVLLLSGACAPASEPLLEGTRGYILISIDTLRADRLGCYGYGRGTSPFLDTLAERGVVFENAYAHIPGTLPSHMSIFTGLYPGEHGVYPPAGILSPEIETLPEAFQRSGFRTAGHTEGGFVHGGYGFARGFDEFSHEARKVQFDVERTVARGLDFLKRLDGDAPFLLFLHTYAVHDPYFPPEKYLERFWSRPVPETFPATGPNFAAFNRGERTLTPKALRFYRASYEASIRYLDDVFKGFFEELFALGLDRETTILLTSDHGEEFLDHGKMVHDQIYRETLHVPLIVLHPGAQARRVGTVVRSIDIAPTFYELAGVEPRTLPSGRSLVRLLAGEQLGEVETYAENFSRLQRGLIRRHQGALYHLFTEWPDGEMQLFDLSTDPRASRDLVAQKRETAEAMKARLYELDHQPISSVRTRELDPELEKRLRGLGYLE